MSTTFVSKPSGDHRIPAAPTWPATPCGPNSSGSDPCCPSPQASRLLSVGEGGGAQYSDWAGNQPGACIWEMPSFPAISRWRSPGPNRKRSIYAVRQVWLLVGSGADHYRVRWWWARPSAVASVADANRTAPPVGGAVVGISGPRSLQTRCPFTNSSITFGSSIVASDHDVGFDAAPR